MAWFTPTELIHEYKNKLFRIYLNKEGEEGIFVTVGGRRFFMKLKRATMKVDPKRLMYWKGRVKDVGYNKLVNDPQFHILFDKERVHPLFSELFRTWPDKNEKKWYLKLVSDWHSDRGEVRKTLLALKSGRLKRPLWDEISALNRALIDAEVKDKGVLKLYRGITFTDYTLDEINMLFYDPSFSLVNGREILDLISGLRTSAGVYFKDFHFASYSASESEAELYGHYMCDFIRAPATRIVAHYRVGFGSSVVDEYIVEAPYRRLIRTRGVALKVNSYKEYGKWPDLGSTSNARFAKSYSGNLPADLIEMEKGSKLIENSYDISSQVYARNFRLLSIYHDVVKETKRRVYYWHVLTKAPQGTIRTFRRLHYDISGVSKFLKDSGYQPFLRFSYSPHEGDTTTSVFFFAPESILKPI